MKADSTLSPSVPDGIVWDLKAPSRRIGPWGENSHSHSAKAGGLQPLGLTRVQPTDKSYWQTGLSPLPVP